MADNHWKSPQFCQERENTISNCILGTVQGRDKEKRGKREELEKQENIEK